MFQSEFTVSGAQYGITTLEVQTVLAFIVLQVDTFIDLFIGTIKLF